MTLEDDRSETTMGYFEYRLIRVTRCPVAQIEFDIDTFEYSNELFGHGIDHLSI